MLLGYKDSFSAYKPLLQNPSWQKVFGWIEQALPNLQEGEHQILGSDIYANLQRTKTIDRAQGLFEAHQIYIDFHYCLDGGEVIEWAPVSQLTIKEPYNLDKDYTLYNPPTYSTSLKMFPGSLAIFFPEDAHMPKISDGLNKEVKKVVIKIKLDAL